MTREVLTKHWEVPAEAFLSVSQMRGDDGYDRMEPAGRKGWTAIPNWGCDGWDLGDWPYVVIYHRDRQNASGAWPQYELAVNCEGDVTVYRYPTEGMRNRATDTLALFYWEGEPWLAGIESAHEMPDHLRGPYTSPRPARNATA